ncbi:MAG: YihY/virulence factor BrkB family protein [Elusimicrobiota bacterium]|nr:YihY/virulence factor BrkB family protein [Elusimicrobiota bacterium]
MNVKLKKRAGRVRATLNLSVSKFIDIDGDQRAAAFSYSAFFSLFPLIVLIVTGTSLLFDRSTASGLVIGFVGKYIPITGDMKLYVSNTISGMMNSRGQAGTLAFLMLVWIATQFFTALIQAANRAWGTTGSQWWKLPLKSLGLLLVTSVAVIAGIWVPMFEQLTRRLLPEIGFITRTYSLGNACLPWALIFLSLNLLYAVAPHRSTKFSEVWAAALCGTLLLAGAQKLFIYYLQHFSTLNAVYGAFGSIMALLLWIYVSGVIFIFGACLSAAQAETREQS